MEGEVYIADGDYIKDIEVNDLRNRYTLTKGSTQKMVKLPFQCVQLISAEESDHQIQLLFLLLLLVW